MFAQAAVRNLLWGCAVVGAPVATVAFVYHVVVMHQDRLRHEFNTAAPADTVETSDPDLIDVKITAPTLADGRPGQDLRLALFGMLIARGRFVDTHGSNPASLTPALRRIAWDMLDDDAAMFGKLQAEKRKDLDTYLFDWRSDEERLHVLHAQLNTLAPRPETTPLRKLGER